MVLLLQPCIHPELHKTTHLTKNHVSGNILSIEKEVQNQPEKLLSSRENSTHKLSVYHTIFLLLNDIKKNKNQEGEWRMMGGINF